MANITANVRHIQRNDTKANWESVNPILSKGEIGVETDTLKFKIGDGVKAYTNLSYCTMTIEEINSLLDTKVDKVSGKQLSTNDYTTAEKNKLANVQANANNYTHPTSHSATMITEDSTHRFVTDTEKNTWNNKTSLTLGTTSSTAYRGDYGNIAYTHANSAHARTDATNVSNSTTNGNIKIDGVETTVYSHPNGTNPHGTTKSDIGLSNVENKSSATIRGEITKENIEAKLIGEITSHTHTIVSVNSVAPSNNEQVWYKIID